ncbi:ethanolamine utilization protein EutN [bacterium]|nr:MAG: ethanolamine utilization protein EutN [bacterium]
MESSLKGFKIAILCEKSDNGAEDYFLAVDTVDAGIGDEVLTVSGSASRQSGATKISPADTAIVAIIDPINSR